MVKKANINDGFICFILGEQLKISDERKILVIGLRCNVLIAIFI